MAHNTSDKLVVDDESKKTNLEELLNNSLEEGLVEEPKTTKQLYSNSNPRASQVKALQFRQNLNFFRRNFMPMEKGSLRLGIIQWVRFSLGAIMVIPFYVSMFGCTTAAVVMLVACAATYYACNQIYHSSHTTRLKDYTDLVEQLAPAPLFKIFRVSFAMDYLSGYMVGGVVNWTLFEYFLNLLGWMRPEWIINPNQLKFNEYHPIVILMRIGFFAVMYLVLLPFFLKESMHSLRVVTIVNFIITIVLGVWVLAESPFFRSYYASKGELQVEYLSKAPTLSWISAIFSIMLFFYVQPFILTLRKEILAPTLQRLKKMTSISLVTQCIIFIASSLAIYCCFGDKYVTFLMFIRQPYDGKNAITEGIFKFIVIGSFVPGIVGMSINNPSTRDFLMKFSEIKDEKARYRFYSTVPLALCFVLGIIVPRVVSILGLIGMLICNYNGFIMPIFMDIELTRRANGSKAKIAALYTLATIYAVFGFVGTIQSFVDDFMG